MLDNSLRRFSNNTLASISSLLDVFSMLIGFFKDVARCFGLDLDRFGLVVCFCSCSYCSAIVVPRFFDRDRPDELLLRVALLLRPRRLVVLVP